MGDTDGWQFLALQEALMGRYSVRRELGRGGMGIVYQAHEVRLDRPVALKVLPPECVGQSALRERFLREARTAAKLSHPNIVPIFAVDEVDDLVFFAMGYIEGETLGQRVRERGPLRPTEAGRMLREVAWALGHAHLHGVVHRDVKPDNILIESGTGRAMVTDFGIAHISETKGLTGAAEILGTADFMSPEQSSGDAVDGRSDLYSLGVVGYYVLTGALPFHGATIAATLGKHLTQQAPVLVTVAPEVPRHLSQTIDRCLAKDPSVRFQTGEALAEALTESLAVRQEMPGPMRVFVEQSRAAGSSVVALGLLVVTMLVIWTVVFLVEGFSDWADIALGAVFVTALAATPVVMLARMARQLLQTGYGHAELLMALRSDVDERRKQLAAEYGDPSLTARWAKGIALGSTAAILGSSATLPFLPPPSVGLGRRGLPGGFSRPHRLRLGCSCQSSDASSDGCPMAPVLGESHRPRDLQGREAAAGERHCKRASVRTHRSGHRNGFASALRSPAQGSKAVVQRTSRCAAGSRAARGEDPGTRRETGRCSHSDRDRANARRTRRRIHRPRQQKVLAQGRRPRRPPRRRRPARGRLGEVVQALETIRLELLRMHAGGGSIESVTADLTSARQLSEDIERRLEGTREVGELLGGAS